MAVVVSLSNVAKISEEQLKNIKNNALGKFKPETDTSIVRLIQNVRLESSESDVEKDSSALHAFL